MRTLAKGRFQLQLDWLTQRGHDTQPVYLRRKLENLKELRDLVKSLGRGGGKGPLRRAPEEVRACCVVCCAVLCCAVLALSCAVRCALCCAATGSSSPNLNIPYSTHPLRSLQPPALPPTHPPPPRQLEQPRAPAGVIRSPLQPEEVRGLTRSGDLSRMLPSEIMLMAHGWPRKAAAAAAAAAAGGASAGGSRSSGEGAGADGNGSEGRGPQDLTSVSLELESLDEEEYYLPGG